MIQDQDAKTVDAVGSATSFAPWTPQEVTSLNDFQATGFMHPFTCGPASDTLIATPEGWVCNGCDWKQNWAPKFMADDSWREVHTSWKQTFGFLIAPPTSISSA